MVTGGALIGLKSLGRWVPCRTVVKRGFAQERPTSNVGRDDEEPKEDSAAAGAASGSQQAQEVQNLKTTTRQETTPDSDSGEIPTPSLIKATTTKDVFISSREERLRQKERAKEVDVMKREETFKKGASTGDLDSG